jgi:mono/diheme cytochrome c family protein
MLRAAMPRFRMLALVAVLAAGGLTACGERGIQLASSDPDYEGAEIFQRNCSGCHTLQAAGTQGSATDANGREYKDGPNFDQRAEEKDQVLYAIQNGGFSSGPMPQDIVVGEEAEKVADFVAKYSGQQAVGFGEPGSAPPEGAQPNDGE